MSIQSSIAYYTLWAALYMGKTVVFQSSFFFSTVLPVIVSKGWEWAFAPQQPEVQIADNAFPPDKELYIYLEENGKTKRIVTRVLYVEE